MKWFNDLHKAAKENALTGKTLGTKGNKIYSGYISSNEKSSKLQGTEKYTTYQNILANTSIAAAGTRFFLNLVAKAEWKYQFADDNDKAKYEDRLYKVWSSCGTPWHRIVRRTAMYRFHGFSFQEWTAKQLDDGTIGYLDIQSRPQFTIEQWNVDPDTGFVNSVGQRNPQTGALIELPRNKMIYAIDDCMSDSPEGMGIFRHIVNSANRLTAYENLEGIGFETDLRGIPIGRAPLLRLKHQLEVGNITQSEYDSALSGLDAFLQNHIKGNQTSLMLDSATYTNSDESESISGVKMYDMELLQGSSNSQDAAAKAIERLNYEIARVLGVEGLLVGGSGAGSQALSRDKSSNLFLLVDSTLKELSEIYENDYLVPLWKMNGWDMNDIPEMKTESIQFRDVTAMTQALSGMAQAGAVLAPDDPAINEMRDLMGLSHQSEPTDLLLPAAGANSWGG